ncbi:IS1634 family transposase [Patescibacteria group bacterium]|nr:IS1634 family transposase [Patescibacteria group bacterium]MBU4397023.1 IS1634 family transposase [Patescibacteria group bacterium]MCG2702568.1 IS1634 family transposase [Candidatus Parcubacteria bacterium]
MFVRQRSNKSGSVSVQIIFKKNGLYKVVKHIGTAQPNSIELEYLLTHAQELKIRLETGGQLTLDGFLIKRKEAELASFASRFVIPNIYKVGFFEVFGLIYDELKFSSVIPEPLFRDLVIARIAKPTSKLSTYRWLRKYTNRNINKNSIYRLLDKLTLSTKLKVCSHVYREIYGSDGKAINIIFFDATTLHFESFTPDDFRKLGFSKVGKHRQPQIVIGLMVTGTGVPVGYEVYSGDKFDGHTIRKALKRVQQQYSAQQVVFVADASMLSKENAGMIEQAGFSYIMAAKIKNLKKKTQYQILNFNQYESSCLDLNLSSQQGYRLIVTYSKLRARKDQHERKRQVERLQKKISVEQKLTKKQFSRLGKMKYLELKGKAKVVINYEAIQKDAGWDGLKGYATNIYDLPADEIVKRYCELWQVEKAFRIAKTDLRIRPIFHYKKQRIKAHLLLVFVSLVVSRILEQKLSGLGLGLERIIENLESVIEIPLQDKKLGTALVIRTEQNRVTQKIYQLLGLSLKTGTYPHSCSKPQKGVLL